MKIKDNMDMRYNESKLSVIVLSYNSDTYIYETIDSICFQDYPYIELIIADDGSKNFDRASLENYILSHKKENIVNYIILHSATNRGTVKNINNAIVSSSGEYIKIIAGDDTYPTPNVFSEQIKNIEKAHSLVSVGKLQQCDSEMNPIKDARTERSNEAIHTVLNMDYIEARKYITNHDIFPLVNQAMCYKREFFLNDGLCDEDYILIEDSPLALRILKNSMNVSELNMITVNHRAKVGISTSRELFSPRRVLYYQDCVTYSKKEVYNQPDIYSWLFRIEHLRTSEFVLKMAQSKKEKKGLLHRGAICVGYFDTIIYYTITHFTKLINRMRDRFSR